MEGRLELDSPFSNVSTRPIQARPTVNCHVGNGYNLGVRIVRLS